ncbi:MAG: hypothetical protein PHF60_02095 [Candidatus ainarchaeum sp.]|nr:hypothetical protein [Candidatus ainarchaeum sp.]
MAGANVTKREDVGVPVTNVATRFKGYAPETERPVRKAEVVEDETLKKLKTAWKRYDIRIETVVLVPDPQAEEYYGKVSKLLGNMGVRCSSGDVEKFCVALVEFQGEENFEEKAGVFLSALMNHGTDEDYRIVTRHLDRLLGYIGYRNIKNITVEGDVRDMLGNAMEGGRIVVNGNTGHDTAHAIHGGEIHINGDCKGLGDIYGGMIHQNGKLIAFKGYKGL